MVNVAQLVRALDCGSKGRGFEPHLSPSLRNLVVCGQQDFFCPYRRRFCPFGQALLLTAERFYPCSQALLLTAGFFSGER